MDYRTIKEVSADWGLGARIISVYCTQGRIEGAVKKGGLWMIPRSAVKPEDKRRKKPGQDLREKEEFFDRWPFQSLYENKDLFAQIVKNFPYPMHICAPDGTMLLANEAFLKFAKISNGEKLYKKHNILSNPNLERWGVKDFTVRAFRGESVFAYDVKVPHQEIIERLGDEKEPIDGSLFQNLAAFPIRGGQGQLLYIVFVFTTFREYRGKEEIVKGKEYIDRHWKQAFDMDKLARAVHLSKYRYMRLFKQHTGMTPCRYYKELKLKKIKELLCESNLSVSQVFAECGVDYSGNFPKMFKRKTGMTPSEYRAGMTRKESLPGNGAKTTGK